MPPFFVLAVVAFIVVGGLVGGYLLDRYLDWIWGE